MSFPLSCASPAPQLGPEPLAVTQGAIRAAAIVPMRGTCVPAPAQPWHMHSCRREQRPLQPNSGQRGHRDRSAAIRRAAEQRPDVARKFTDDNRASALGAQRTGPARPDAVAAGTFRALSGRYMLPGQHMWGL